MKRVVALFLIAALCLALAACGKESKYADLERMLDEGRYSEALAYILALQGGSGLIAVPEGGSSAGTAAPKIDDESQAIIDSLMGDWIYTGTEEDAPKAFTFRKDGTCTVDGQEMTWEYGSDGSFMGSGIRIVYLQLKEGESETYEISASLSDKGVTVFDCQNDNEYFSYYICPDRYETVELTLDNWQEYFEWTEEFFHGTDAFGDISSRGTYYRFVLKQAYLDRLSDYAGNTGAVEITYSTANHRITINSDGTTYTKGGFADVGYTGGTHTGKHGLFLHYSNTWFGAEYCSELVWQADEHYGSLAGQMFCEYVETRSVDRIQGTLYLLKTQ